MRPGRESVITIVTLPSPELATFRVGPISRGPVEAARRPLDVLALGFGALLAAAIIAFGSPLILVLPLVPLAAIATARRPEFAIFSIFGLLGFQGTITAHLGLSVNLITNLLIAGLLIGVLAKFMFGGRGRSVWVWPGLLLAFMYVGISLLQVGFSDSAGEALSSFRTSTYFLTVALVIALAPWSRKTFVAMARAAVLVGLAVGLYALFRFIVGSSGPEQILAQQTWIGLGRPASIAPSFFGSFPFAPTMAAYAAGLAPFALILLLADRGRWRAVSGAALVGLIFAILASENRTGLVAAALGVAVVLLLFAISPAFPSGRRISTTMVALVGVVVLGISFYSLAVTDQADRDRYERLVTDPGSDPAYFLRLSRWDFAIDTAADEPFGYGLGSQGTIAYERPEGPVGPRNLDSSYLKIAIEQGFIVLGIYAAALLAMLTGLASFVRRTRDRAVAALAIAGAGTLVATATLFYAALTIEGLDPIPLWMLVGIGIAMPCTRRWIDEDGSKPAGAPRKH